MPVNLSDIEKRLWSADDEFRANSNTEKGQRSGHCLWKDVASYHYRDYFSE